MHRAMPREAQVYGDTDSRKAPTLKDSPLPVKSIYAPTTVTKDPMPPAPYLRLIAAVVCVSVQRGGGKGAGVDEEEGLRRRSSFFESPKLPATGARVATRTSAPPEELQRIVSAAGDVT
jgi:hypothetical protein